LDAHTVMVRKGQVVCHPGTEEPMRVPDHQIRLAYIDRVIAIVGAAHKASDDTGPKVSNTFITLIQKLGSLPTEKKRRFAVDGDFAVFKEVSDGNGNHDT